MTKTFTAFAALVALSSPALAETMTRDGVTYTYSVAQQGKIKVISGTESKSRQPFVLRVSGSWVSGTVAGNPVSFSTREVVPSSTVPASTVIAAR